MLTCDVPNRKFPPIFTKPLPAKVHPLASEPDKSTIPRDERTKQLGRALPFIAPWLVGFFALTLYPFAASLYWSFCQYDLLNDPTWGRQ